MLSAVDCKYFILFSLSNYMCLMRCWGVRFAQAPVYNPRPPQPNKGKWGSSRQLWSNVNESQNQMG